jgi:tRNA pseudouridine13 synthase
LRFYINAYQSYLWNLTLAQYLEKNGKLIKEVKYSLGKFVFTPETFPKLKLPLIGFGIDIDKNINDIIKEIISKEKITFNDFIIKQIPELSQEGELREAFFEVSNLNINKLEKDELNAEKNKITVSFILPKGSYATLVIKYLF